VTALPGRLPNDELLVSDAERGATEAELSDACAQGRLSVDELSARLDRAHAARTRGELATLVGDLPAGTALGAMSGIRPTRWTVAIMGGSVRRGRWRPSERTTGIAVMGGTVLDMRETALDSHPQRVTAIAVMGGVEIIVPEGTRVELRGVPVMGCATNRALRAGASPAVAERVVHVRALALMGGVQVKTKPAREGIEGHACTVVS
jgi:hypothetical protein